MPKVDEERVQRIEDLVRRLEECSDDAAREIAHPLMEAILELHGAGLERMMDIIFESGDSGKTAIRRFAGDSLLASLLVLHGLHPDDIETRVQHTLGKIQNAELIGVFDGVVRVRLIGSQCGLREAVEEALRGAIPDAADIVIEESLPSSGFVPLAALGAALPRIA